MFFGTLNQGMGYFHPDRLIENAYCPPIVITSFTRYVSGKEGTEVIEVPGISTKDNITLSHRDNTFSISFAALSYENPSLNQYSYQLQGLSDNWIDLKFDNKITFTRMPPGRYTFNIKGSNNHGVWSPAATSLKIVITPPWWASTWAYFVYALLVLIGLYLIRHFELKKQQRKLNIEQEKLTQQQRINSVTSKFVPNAFIHSLGRKDIMEVKLGDAVARETTVMFSDIRDYTALSENMTPEENFQFINAFNRRMGPIIQQNQGFVNQYLGDAIMALFKNSPKDGLLAAIQMQQTLLMYNQERTALNLSAIRLGIGIHTGPLIMGIIGDDQRMDATTISDAVNTASRIESLTKHFKVNILLSEESLLQIEREYKVINTKSKFSDFNTRFLGKVQLKGKKEPVGIYECFDGDRSDVTEKKRASLSFFKEGMELYFSKQFMGAADAFEKVLEINAADQTAQFFLDKTTTFLANDLPEDWTGVEVMTFK